MVDLINFSVLINVIVLKAIIQSITKEERKMFRDAFNEFDKNGDGSISTKESIV